MHTEDVYDWLYDCFDILQRSEDQSSVYSLHAPSGDGISFTPPAGCTWRGDCLARRLIDEIYDVS